MKSDLVILVPVLGRVHRIQPLLDSIKKNTPRRHRVLFLASPQEKQEIAALEEAKAEFVVMDKTNRVGDYAKKINYGYRVTVEPYIFLGADDIEFHPRWFENAMREMKPGIGVVGTNDLGHRRVMAGEHSTHSLVSRRYIEAHGLIDEPGKVLFEGYIHEYVDNELVGTAKARNAFAFAADSIVKHLHPNWGLAPMDTTYALQRQRMKQSFRLYKTRERLWT